MITINLFKFGGRGSSGGSGSKEGGAPKKKASNPAKIDQNETYELIRVRDDGTTNSKGEKSGADAKILLKGYHYDKPTGLWRNKEGQVYRVRNVNDKQDEKVRAKKTEMTVLVRDKNGKISVRRTSNYSSRKELASKLSSSGFHVFNVWQGNVSNEDVQKWIKSQRKK